MYNQAVEYDSKTSAWTYSPVKYWPNRDGDKISSSLTHLTKATGKAAPKRE